jgi:hypothetical protein
MNLVKVIVITIMSAGIFFACEDPKIEDTTPPSVAITSPQNNSIVNEIVQVMCISLDNDQVDKVELWIDGSFTGIYDTSEPYSLEWNTTTYENRTFTITIRSFDVSGNAADSSPFSLTVDNSLSVPTTSNIASISYGPGGFSIIWDKSIDEDFESYSLDKSLFQDMSGKSQIFSSFDKEDTVFVDSDIDPLIFQYYRVTVTDSLNYFSHSSVASSDLDPIPSPVDIQSVIYDTTAMIITWDISNETDFLQYEIHQSSGDSNNYAIISTITDINISEYSISEFDPLQINYFRVLVFDTLGQYAQGDYYSNSIDSPPNSVDVTSVTYTSDDMTVSWDQYVPNLYRLSLRSATEMENDFVSYDVLYSETVNGAKAILTSISDEQVTSYSITDFNPTHENWFWINVNDYWGQTSIGNGSTNPIEPLPESVDVLSVEYDLTQMIVTWEQFTEEDFQYYRIYSSITETGDRELLYTYDHPSETTHTLYDYDPTYENWFWIEVLDKWGQSVLGNGLSNSADSFPQPINVTSVTYNTESMIVEWDESQDNDFASYELLQSINGNPLQSILFTSDITTTSFTLESIDPTDENTFQVRVADYWGLETIGSSMANEIELPPTAVTISPITFTDGLLNISWSENTDTDFQEYNLYESATEDMVGRRSIFSSTNQEETSFTRSAEYGLIRYYQVSVTDIYELETISLVERGGEYILFNTAFGGSSDDVGYSVKQTNDGGYIMAGYTESFGIGSSDVWLVKTNSFGIEEWTQTYGGIGADMGKYIQITSDGGFIITGSTHTYTDNNVDLYLIKTDESGNEIWSQTFGGLSQDIGECVKETMDGGFIITGEIIIPDASGGGDNNRDMYLIKTDINGIEQWSNNFGGDYRDKGYSVVQSSDGGYVVAGYYGTLDSSSDYNQEMWVLKTDSEGLEEWNQTYGGVYSDVGYSLIEAEDGGFVITGMADGGDTWLLKIDYDGMEEWSHTYLENNNNHGNFVEQTSDGGFIIAGVTGGEGLLIKTNSAGEDEWRQFLGGAGADWFNSVHQTNDGGFILSGSTRSFSFGQRDAYLVKTDPEGNTISIE